MKTQYCRIDNPLGLEAACTQVGRDWVVVIGGGGPHIGAVGIGMPRASLKQDGSVSSSASVYCLLGHKEDLLAREAAMILSANLQVTVVVTVGIHFDAIDSQLLFAVEAAFRQLLEKITILCQAANSAYSI